MGRRSSFQRNEETSKCQCFSCCKIVHLRRDCRQVIPRSNISSGNGKNRRTLLSGICRRCGKGQHWINECRSTKDRQGNLKPLGNSLGVPHRPPSQTWPTYSQSLWRTCLTRKVKKNPLPAVTNHTVLNGGINMEDESKMPIENRSYIFCRLL